MKKNYIVTPQLMNEFNQGDFSPWLTKTTNFTGFLFLTNKTTEKFFSCSCDEQGAINYRKNHCPHCGGELYEGFLTRRTLDTRCNFNRWEIKQISKASWVFYYHERWMELDSATGEYCFRSSVRDVGRYSLPYSLTLDESALSGKEGQLFSYLQNIQEFVLMKKLSGVKSNVSFWSSRVPYERYLQELGKLMSSCGASADELRSQSTLYGIFFAHKIDIGVPENNLEDYLLSMRLDSKTIEVLINLFKNKNWRDGMIDSFAVNKKQFEGFCKQVQSCVNEEYPNGSFILDLVSREVMDLFGFVSIMNFFSVLRHKGEFSYTFQSPIVKSDENMVFDFADFLKKNSARKRDITNLFKERATKLQEMGHPIILENLLDKNYYALLNASAYSSSIEDFDDAFKRDPLQCMKNMK